VSRESSPIHVVYMVSRFPNVSETFVLRELNEVAATDGVEADLASLFPPSNPFVHPAARPWVSRLRRPGARESATAILWWSLRRPLRLISSALSIGRGYAPRPRLLLRALATLPVAAAHARWIAQSRPDHVHAHFASYPALAAWLCHRMTGISYSFTAHAHDIFVQQCFLDRKIGDASFVATISDFNRRFLLPHRPGDRPPIEVVHCGIDPGAYRFDPRPLRREGPVRLLCVASLQDYKGHRVLFDALGRGGTRLDRVALDLVGAGKLEGELRDRAASLGLEPRIRFHGNLPEPEVARMLGRADGFVLPSVTAADGRQDGIPVALMEAIACGLPVIASRLSGIPELVREGESGALATPGDASDLALQMARLIEGELELNPVAARERIERDFDIARTSARMVELFRTPP
jgi:colanic acid/amylovoran biosynthesis glycosyltransferase